MNRAWLLILFLPMLALASEPVALNAEQELRYQALTQELRCLVCQNQNIADSHAPLAEDLREQVRSQMAAGRTDTEIKNYMTDRYGDFVLYKPPLNLETLLLWIGPALLVALGLVVAIVRIRRAKAPENRAVADSEKLKKILDGAP